MKKIIKKLKMVQIWLKWFEAFFHIVAINFKQISQ